MTNDERAELDTAIELFGLSKKIEAQYDHREDFREISRAGAEKAWLRVMELLNKIDS